MPLQYFNKEVRGEVDCLPANKHQSFLQVNFNITGIKVGDIVISDGHDQTFSKYSKWQVCNIFTISRKRS